MKQHITKEQWDELDEESKERYHNAFGFEWFRGDECCDSTDGDLEELDDYPNIGQMIEFLGEWIANIRQGGWGFDENTSSFEYIYNWDVELYYEVSEGEEYEFKIEEVPELCDALWEAVKYKLKHERS